MTDRLRSERHATTPFAIDLLRASAGHGPLNRVPDDAEIDWLVKSGLGPILWEQVRATPERLSAQALQQLKSADLTARILTAETFDALAAILDQAAAQNCPVTLLKGVSIAQQYYPERHWRPMRDIDLLVSVEDQARLENILRELGFHQESHLPPEFYAHLQHSMPFYHPKWRCWVEVHTALFRANKPEGHIDAFQATAIFANHLPLPHERGAFWRMPDEDQLVYIAVHWGAKLTLVGGLIPIMDTLMLLKCTGSKLDWERVLNICEDVAAARHLALMLAYLRRHGLADIPEHVWQGLAHGRRSIGALGLKILLDTIDDYLAAGHDLNKFTSEAMLNIRWSTLLGEDHAVAKLMLLSWRVLFPPNEPRRYDPGKQLKRLGSLLHRLSR